MQWGMRIIWFFIAGLLLFAPDALAGGKTALVVGNSAYPNGALRNPANDARAVAETLEELGFSVLLKIDADRKNFLYAIHAFTQEIRSADVALFYYAGHGVQLSGRNYLIPVDTSIRDEIGLEIEGVDVYRVIGNMGMANSKLNIIILDACRDNPFAGAFRAFSTGLAGINAPVGTLIAYSTAPGKVAEDGSGEHSPYTKHLLSAMKKPGLLIEDVFKEVRAGVMRETEGRQAPWESSSLVGNFSFAPETPEPAPTPNPTPTPTASLSSLEDVGLGADLLFWSTIKDSQNREHYEEYLRVFPQGKFAGLARMKVEELTREEGAPFPDTVSGLQPGQQGWAAPEALMVDTGNKVWIDPDAPVRETRDDAHLLLVIRTEQGVSVDITRVQRKWKKSAAKEGATPVRRLIY